MKFIKEKNCYSTQNQQVQNQQFKIKAFYQIANFVIQNELFYKGKNDNLKNLIKTITYQKSCFNFVIQKNRIHMNFTNRKLHQLRRVQKKATAKKSLIKLLLRKSTDIFLNAKVR